MAARESQLTFAGLLIAALLIEPLAKRLHLPFSAALVAAGFAGSEILVAMGIDTGLRWYHFTDLILQVLMPILIFEAACTLNTRDLLRDLIPIFILAVPLLLVATSVTAALIYFAIAHAGFSVERGAPDWGAFVAYRSCGCDSFVRPARPS